MANPRPPRKFQMGDKAVPRKGVYRGDVGTVIGTESHYCSNSKGGHPLHRVAYVVQLDDNVVRKFFSQELHHP